MDRVAISPADRHGRRNQAVWAGADIGGTWLRIAAWRGGRQVPRIVVPAERDLRRLADTLDAVWRRRRWDRRRVAGLVVASRALWTEGERRSLARRLRRFASRVLVISDAQAALLGALAFRPGLLVLSGTGSIVVGWDGRRWARAGGLGPFVGDEGSGFWIGREWLRTITRNGRLAPTLRIVHGPDPVRTIAALTPRVLERARRGDRRARRIVRAGQEHLAGAALEVARQLRLGQPLDASWAGSVLDHTWFRAGLVRAIARIGLRARWHRPAAEPVVAAARLARQLARA
jgi:N-acetylglucosamine kinase-like BadF-type ATPase